MTATFHELGRALVVAACVHGGWERSVRAKTCNELPSPLTSRVFSSVQHFSSLTLTGQFSGIPSLLTIWLGKKLTASPSQQHLSHCNTHPPKSSDSLISTALQLEDFRDENQQRRVSARPNSLPF